MKGDDRMAFVPRFIDAEREQCKASIMIEGLTGQGKSGLALAFGYILSGKQWDKVYFIDTENRSDCCSEEFLQRWRGYWKI